MKSRSENSSSSRLIELDVDTFIKVKSYVVTAAITPSFGVDNTEGFVIGFSTLVMVLGSSTFVKMLYFALSYLCVTVCCIAFLIFLFTC